MMPLCNDCGEGRDGTRCGLCKRAVCNACIPGHRHARQYSHEPTDAQADTIRRLRLLHGANAVRDHTQPIAHGYIRYTVDTKDGRRHTYTVRRGGTFTCKVREASPAPR